MKRDFLVGLGVDADNIDKIMSENGKDVEGLKAQLSVQKGLVLDLTAKSTDDKKKLDEFDKLDINKITLERDSYKAQYDKALLDKESAITQLKYDSVLDASLGKYKFSSSFAKAGIRSKLLESKLELKDDAIVGFDEAVKGLMESNADAFTDGGGTTKKPQFTSALQNQGSNMSKEEYLSSKYKDNPWAK